MSKTHTATRRAGEGDDLLIERVADAAGQRGLVWTESCPATCANCSIWGGVAVAGNTLTYATDGYVKAGEAWPDGRVLTGCHNCDE
jgi:hypothetical protein